MPARSAAPTRAVRCSCSPPPAGKRGVRRRRRSSTSRTATATTCSLRRAAPRSIPTGTSSWRRTRGEASTRICAYYSLTLAELENQHLPEASLRKLPRRIPGVRLGRLAVDLQYQSKGLGELLLVDALTRVQRICAQAGGIGLFVDAIDERAANYYRRFGFNASPDNPLLLFLSARVLG